MSNPYYEQYASFPAHEVARGDTLEREFHGVEVGFDRITQGASGGGAGLVQLDARLRAIEDRNPNAYSSVITGHGLTALPAYGFMAVYATGSGLAQADSSGETTVATAYVVKIVDANTLELMTEGMLEVPAGHGLTTGLTYYLAGAVLSPNVPTTGVSQPLCEVWTANLLRLFSHRPLVI